MITFVPFRLYQIFDKLCFQDDDTYVSNLLQLLAHRGQAYTQLAAVFTAHFHRIKILRVS